MTNWPGNDNPQAGSGGYGGPNPVGGDQPTQIAGWQQSNEQTQLAPQSPITPNPQYGAPTGTPYGAPQPPAYGAPAGQPYGQQVPGAPYGNPQVSGGQYGAPQFGAPPSAPKNRKPLIITLIAGGAVLLIAAIVGVIALASGGSDSKSGTAGDMVKGYLEALARGDAAEALSYSDDQPGSKEFLTDEILKKQIEKAPITNIKILSDDSKGAIGFGQVHVSASFGDKVSDETLSVKKSNKQWRLDHAAVKLDKLSLSSDDKMHKVLTLFGKPIPDSAIYVFPGWIDLATNNANLKVTNEMPLLNELSGYSSFSSLNIEIDITDAGKKAAAQAVKDAIAKCTASTALKPPSCPMGVDEPGAQENSAKWGAPDLSKLEVDNFSSYSMDCSFSIGSVEFPVEIRMNDGGAKRGSVTSYVSGDVDMTQNPPGVSFR